MYLKIVSLLIIIANYPTFFNKISAKNKTFLFLENSKHVN